MNLVWNGQTSGICPDFIETLWHAHSLRPYQFGSIYPALPYVLLFPFSQMVPRFFFEELPVPGFNRVSLSPQAFLVTISFFALCFFILFLSITFKNKKDKYLFVIMTLLSGPFIFMLERDNVLILTVALLMIFVKTYDAKDRRVCWAGFSCLAIAVAMKLYPVVFGLLLLGKRENVASRERIKDILTCVFFGCAAFFVPFLLIREENAISQMLQNIFSNSEAVYRFGLGQQISLRNMLNIVSYGIYGRVGFFSNSSVTIFMLLLGVMSVLGAAFCQTKWKKIAILTLLIILLPPFSMKFNGLYMIIPLYLFFTTNTRQNKSDYLYASLFALVLAPLVFGPADLFPGAEVGAIARTMCNYSTVVSGFTNVFFLGTLIIDSVNCMLRKHWNRERGSLPLATDADCNAALHMENARWQER